MAQIQQALNGMYRENFPLRLCNFPAVICKDNLSLYSKKMGSSQGTQKSAVNLNSSITQEKYPVTSFTICFLSTWCSKRQQRNLLSKTYIYYFLWWDKKLYQNMSWKATTVECNLKPKAKKVLINTQNRNGNKMTVQKRGNSVVPTLPWYVTALNLRNWRA